MEILKRKTQYYLSQF